MNLLETKGLSCHFGGLKAVENVNFQLNDGSIRAIIGPNGAGKTTFVSLITGRTPATSGRVFFAGEDVSRLPAHKRIERGMAYTFQITSVFPELTVFENAMLAVQRVHNGTERSLRHKTRHNLEVVDIDRFHDRPAGELAYGHQRLLEIAMGFAQNPRLLILDEPTQGLSGREISDFVGLIGELSREMTILLIEHNMDVVMALAHTITVFDQGEILAEGTPSQIQGNADVQAAYLGT